MTDDTEVLSDGSDAAKVAIVEVLPGFTIHPLDDGETATEAFLLIKTLDADGGFSWAYRTTRPPNREELLGALTVQVALLRKELLEDWVSS